MRPLLFQIFLTGIAIIGLGIFSPQVLPKNPALEFLQGAFTLGGGILICGFFALKMHWHGIIGAAVMALLGTARGAANLPDFFRFVAGDRSRSLAPLLEFAVTAASVALLAAVVRTLLRERVRRLQESREAENRPADR
ncbi:MAG: hypothetical protein V4733_11455 [Verrucomicrobiota bacterium]